MQRKQQQKELLPSQNIMAIILESIPKEANVTKIEYEGPRIALYTNSPRYLMENNQIIANLVNVIKKRIVVRTDQSIRKSEEDICRTRSRGRVSDFSSSNSSPARLYMAG